MHKTLRSTMTGRRVTIERKQKTSKEEIVIGLTKEFFTEFIAAVDDASQVNLRVREVEV